VEKQIVIVSVPDAYITIADMVPVVFTDSEVYRVSEIAAAVCFKSFLNLITFFFVNMSHRLVKGLSLIMK
jgi:hypothetical protein